MLLLFQVQLDYKFTLLSYFKILYTSIISKTSYANSKTQEAQLLQRDRAMLRVTECFVKSHQDHSMSFAGPGGSSVSPPPQAFQWLRGLNFSHLIKFPVKSCSVYSCSHRIVTVSSVIVYHQLHPSFHTRS